MLCREDFEQREREIMAPYASLSAETAGREHDEPVCPNRTHFQRDRDRIIHSGAFRRLEYKTQVFVNHEGDYYRTRLTHSLEVAQISRALARTFGLNEDLAEAIALAHDLGHTPFGHRGEGTMNDLMRDHGGFEHNRQSFRVVTYLEQRYPQFNGLNLTFEVREGIVKHTGEYDAPDVPNFTTEGYPTLEAQIVNVADQIAYMHHDLDDGLESGMLTFEQLENVPVWNDIYRDVIQKFPKARKKYHKYQTIRRVLSAFINDIQDETARRIEEFGINSLTDVRERGEEIVALSDGMKKETRVLLDALFKGLYQHYRVERMAQKSDKVLRDLFRTYLDNPWILPPTLAKLIDKDGLAHLHVCDYIAGMTDRFALQEHAKLFNPQERV
jgi:dGTPase